ncbi:hypothetical protein TD95_001016 [Thielaviopsis punctulata]|uniref:TRUD domain-containing protein n=1 Tax=Thielaviopsis punctulata TaxID=72032 RepID=A0A0F4ZJJ9_9PEZI|nr:hypothetical protein TD95_001016 [Thielaviopsis punctulata]
MQSHRPGPDDAAIGITERVSSSDFSWSDFLVNEIQCDGTVLHLTRFTPVEVTHVKKARETDATTTDTKPAATEPPTVPEIPQISNEDKAALVALVGEEATAAFISLFTASFSPDTMTGRKGPSATSPVLDDKATRSKLHQEVRRIFNSTLDTSTNDSGAIVATIMPKRGGRRNNPDGGIGRRGDSNSGRPCNSRQIECPGSGDYLHFNLYKMNRDTMEAAAQIAKQLNLKPQMIQYAGTKDRRAVTVQRCSVRRRKPHELDRLNSRLYDICIGDFSYNPEPAHLGMLAGNEFTIALKGCDFSGSEGLGTAEKVAALDKNVNASLVHMHTHGWINYFGHQRFGTFAIGTHDVGRLILSGDMKAAVAALLSYDSALAERADGPNQPVERSAKDEVLRSWACRAFCENNDAEGALRRLPRRYGAEMTIIRHLSQRPTDHMGAILRITRGLRTMYLHAYQSFVWNHAASKRWALYGDKVVAGDLVRDEKSAATEASKDVEVDQDGEEVVRAADSADDNDDDAFAHARVVTAEEAASGTLSIFDVVLPTPGHTTLLPTNEIGDFYREFMKTHGGLDPADMVRPQREFSLTGRYRPLMARFLAAPSGFVKACADELEQLTPTDLDVLKAAQAEREAAAIVTTTTTAAAAATTTEKLEDGGKKRSRDGDADVISSQAESKKAKVGEDGKAATPAAFDEEKSSIAVVVKFQLAKSAYATVALRELMGAAPGASVPAPSA